MSTHAFNTLEQAENLQKNGFSEQEAKGLVQVIVLAQSSFATKDDIKNLEQQIKLDLRLEIQQECNAVRQELQEFKEEIRQEFTVSKEETRREFSSIHKALAQLDAKILRMTTSLSGVLVVALGVYTTIMKLIS